jgi:hypothetical protein
VAPFYPEGIKNLSFAYLRFDVERGGDTALPSCDILVHQAWFYQTHHLVFSVNTIGARNSLPRIFQTSPSQPIQNPEPCPQASCDFFHGMVELPSRYLHDFIRNLDEAFRHSETISGHTLLWNWRRPFFVEFDLLPIHNSWSVAASKIRFENINQPQSRDFIQQ